MEEEEEKVHIVEEDFKGPSLISRKDSKNVRFESQNNLNEDANSEASFGRSEIDINTLGSNFDKVHFSNYAEGA